MTVRCGFVIGLFCLLAGTAAAQDKTVFLASLDWPPYTMESLPHGASEQVARKAFAAMGYTLVTEFFPWQRAVLMGRTDHRFVGYYPEYQSTALKDCVFSAPMGESPLGLLERKDAHLKGKSLDDLKGTPIGVVSGYVNTPEFDSRVQLGQQMVEATTDDTSNMRKVLGGRIPAAVIDKNVMDYLLATQPLLKGHGDVLEFDPAPMAVKTLHVCFRNDEDGKKMAEIFNQGLRHIDVKAIMASYLSRIGS